MHSYVKMPGDRTAYLSELAAGDEVLVVSPRGEARVATVGRVKIEHRPLVRVDAREAQTGDEISVFLQNAETVKETAWKYIRDQELAIASIGPTQFLPDYNWFRSSTYNNFY